MGELKKILELCNKRGITIADLASKINVNKATLYRSINSGEIKLTNLRKIANAFEVPISFFFDEASMLDQELSKVEIASLKKKIIELEEILEDKKELISFYKGKINEIIDGDLKGVKQDSRRIELIWEDTTQKIEETYSDLCLEEELLAEKNHTIFEDGKIYSEWENEEVREKYNKIHEILHNHIFKKLCENPEIIKMYQEGKIKNHPFMKSVINFMKR
ncbi:MAG: helix-turn-helix transcriptional regulator [Bacteroidetes bacterium]|nr:helix-turn-helix transcriptional regulator [Bacteroidota bacterium]